MKVCGFTFIKNAILYDYPIEEAIRSILPICDKVIVAVGKSEDSTRALVESIHSDKVEILDTIWDESLREGGRVLAEETNKAFCNISSEYDWAIYIQGDEVLHEDGLSDIAHAMKVYKDDIEVDGLLLKYLHFYASYDFVGTSSKWYKNEIRIIKNDKNIYSYRDAQGFRKGNNEKLKVVLIPAFMHHYGWVKPPQAMQRKQESFQKLWHSDEWVNKNVSKVNEFNYEKHVASLRKFEGTHPEVMKSRINKVNWQFDFDPSFNKLSIKDRFKNILYSWFGIDLNYKNYIKIKRRDHLR